MSYPTQTYIKETSYLAKNLEFYEPQNLDSYLGKIIAVKRLKMKIFWEK